MPTPGHDFDLSRMAWTDLVFHVLSFVETVPGDHSSLYSEAYEHWCRLHLSGELQEAGAESRRYLSALYREAPRSHILHMFPVLWDSIDGFLGTECIPFGRIAWDSSNRRKIAEHIGDCLSGPLIELFRGSLQAVAKAGFEVEWKRVMAPRELAYAKRLRLGIKELSTVVPNVDEVAWEVSFPLRQHGRSIDCHESPPRICVGVPDAMLGVDEDHPLMQGCHEFLVWRELMSCADSAQADTVDGKEGYATFIQAEMRALSVGQRILGEGPWKNAYLRWKATVCREA